MCSGFHSLPPRQAWKHPKKSCSLPCHRPPQADPCHSAHTAPSGCFHQTQSSAAGTEGCDTVGVGTESLFYCSTHCKMLRTSTSAEWLRWKCDTGDARTVSTAHTAVSEKKKKKIKWFILFKTANIRRRLSTWRRHANVHIIPLSVSHFIW